MPQAKTTWALPKVAASRSPNRRPMNAAPTNIDTAMPAVEVEVANSRRMYSWPQSAIAFSPIMLPSSRTPRAIITRRVLVDGPLPISSAV
ncbi:hypothetical protein D3C81_1938700 [compost metagenome]